MKTGDDRGWEPGPLLLAAHHGDRAAAIAAMQEIERKNQEERKARDAHFRLRAFGAESQQTGVSDYGSPPQRPSNAILGDYFRLYGAELVGEYLLRFLRNPDPTSTKRELAAAIVELIGDELAEAIAAAVERTRQ